MPDPQAGHTVDMLRPMAVNPVLKVCAGVIQRRGRFLLARRAPGRQLAGFWEFPGGKLEVGETPGMCLVREFFEEFRVLVRADRFLMRSMHVEPDRTVELLVYRLQHLRGRFQLLVHDGLHWCPRSALLTLPLAPADIPVARRLMAQTVRPPVSVDTGFSGV